MPKRIPLGAIGVTREGKTVYPAIGTDKTGEPFDFTPEELAEIAKLEKASGTQLVRKLIVEDNSAPAPLPDEGTETKLTLANTKKQLQAAAAEREIEFVEGDSKEVLLGKIEAFDAADEDL
jgi:hypothetical protein